jgi:hypothetical protein
VEKETAVLPRISVRKMLIDGKQWGIWEPYALPAGQGLVLLWTPAGTELRWATGTFQATYNGLHYWWAGEQYLIGAHYDGERFAGCYCDVVLPLVDAPLEAPEREYVDLYIDLVVNGDRSWYSKDQEIYDKAERVLPQLRPERPAAEATLERLEAWAAAWSGPFERVPLTLPRTDWHLLDPDSPALAEAVSRLRA